MSAKEPTTATLGVLDGASNAQSFDAVYRRYAPYVGSIALRILGRDDDVDDVVQDVFLDAYSGLSELRDPGAVKGWLARVTVRISVRKLRRRRLRAMFRLDHHDGYERITDGAASPETRTLLASVYATLDRVAAEDRVAWTLRYLQEEDLERVAELSGTSLATVKRRIARANAILRGDPEGGHRG